MIREGLTSFLKAFSDIEVIGEAGSGEEAIYLAKMIQPDVILMDLFMPDMSGIDATQVIREAAPQIQVLAVTNSDEADIVQAALRAGAIGYLLKDISAENLAEAIRAAHSGKPTLAPEAAEVLIRAATRPSQARRAGSNLTERELEVLALMVEGLSNPDIANRLGVSRSTIKTHVSNVLAKLEADSRTEAVALALQRRLVE